MRSPVLSTEENRIAKTVRADLLLGFVYVTLALALSGELMRGRLTYSYGHTVTALVGSVLLAGLKITRGVRGRIILKTGNKEQKRHWLGRLGPEENPNRSTQWSRRITIGFGILAIVLGAWFSWIFFSRQR